MHDADDCNPEGQISHDFHTVISATVVNAIEAVVTHLHVPKCFVLQLPCRCSAIWHLWSTHASWERSATPSCASSRPATPITSCRWGHILSPYTAAGLWPQQEGAAATCVNMGCIAENQVRRCAGKFGGGMVAAELAAPAVDACGVTGACRWHEQERRTHSTVFQSPFILA